MVGVNRGSGNSWLSFKPLGMGFPGDGATLLIFRPRRPGDIATHHAFNREALDLFHHHRPPGKIRGVSKTALGRKIGIKAVDIIHGFHQMIGH